MQTQLKTTKDPEESQYEEVSLLELIDGPSVSAAEDSDYGEFVEELAEKNKNAKPSDAAVGNQSSKVMPRKAKKTSLS